MTDEEYYSLTDDKRAAYDAAVHEWERSPMRGRLKYLERDEAGNPAEPPYGDGT